MLLRVDDPDFRYAGVRLCSDLSLRDPDFRREDGVWILRLPPARIARLEYQLELLGQDGSSEIVCDPANPERAPGAFGDKSVLLAPGYHAPAWLDAKSVPGSVEHVPVRVLGQNLDVGIWSPGGGSMPLLVAHDGPEYDSLSALTRYVGTMIAQGALPPFRVALLPPGVDRDSWYSASAVYGRALVHRILPAVQGEFETAGAVVGMGASLGALAFLQAQRTWPGTFGGLFLQSGSFFVPRFDRRESGFPRYGRVVRFVRHVLRGQSHPEPVPVTMTCGADEENIHNNRLMASALSAQGYTVDLHEVLDLHNYTGWRDAFDPQLTGLLSRLWTSS